MSNIDEQLKELVIANRILAREGVVDGFGHASIRHPEKPDHFIMACSRSPELVVREDLMVFAADGTPVENTHLKPYAERFIHAGMYEARSDVHAVVHNHSYAVIPFSVTNTKVRPLLHVAATIGADVPIWDIHDHFHDTDLLVVNMEQARDLAKTVGDSTTALMRGHGSVVVGRDIRSAVISAVYLQVNANLQTEAMKMGEIRYLTEEEVKLAYERNLSPFVVARIWEYWSKRAGVEEI
jgi:ribulose-5-phosphate 4-epimerase/fuculose-1-phosphate aldolase